MNRETCNNQGPHINRIEPSMFCVVDNPVATAGVCQVNYYILKLKLSELIK